MPNPNPRRLFARRGDNGRSAPKAAADTDILTRTSSQPQPPTPQWAGQAAGSPLRASMNLRKGLQAENSFTVHRRRHSLPTSATSPGRASKGSRMLLWFRWRRRAASPSATTSPNSSQPIPHIPPPASSGVKETLAKTRRGIAALYADTDTECYNRARNDACTCASCMAIADAKENSPSPSFGREQRTARSAQTPPSPVKSSPRCEISMSSSSPILIPVPGGSERTSNSNNNPGEDNGSRARPMARTIARMKKGDSIGDAWECEKGANVEAVTGISRSTLASLPRQTFNVVNVLSQHVRAGCAPQGQSLGLSSYSTYCPRWALLGTPGDNWAPLGTAQRARLRVYATEMRRFVERSLGYTLGAAEELAALFAEIAITCPVPPSYEPDRPPRFQLKSIAQGELAAMSVKEEQEFCSRMREYLSFLEKCTTVPVRVIHEMNADSLDFIHALAIAGSDRLYHGDYQDNAEFTADFGSALRRSNTLPSHSSKWSSKFMARNAFPGELAKPWKPLTKIERAMLKSHITDIRKQVETFVVHSPFRDHPDVLASVLAEISLTWPVPLRTEPTRPPRWHTRSIPKADWDLTSFSDRQIFTTRVKKYLQFLSDTMRMTVSDIKRLSSDDFDRVHAIAIFKHIEFTAELTSYPPPPVTLSLAESRQRKTRSATTDPHKERDRSSPLPNIVSPSTSVDSRQLYDGYGQGSRSDGYDQAEYRQTAQSKTQTPSESSDQAYVNETVETPVDIEAGEDKRPISVVLANKLEHEAKETKWYLHLASKNVDALSYTLKGISRSPEAEDEVGEVEKLDGGILESSEKSSSNEEGSPRVSRKSPPARAKPGKANGNALESVNSSLESEGNQSPPRKVNPFQHMRDYSDVMPETQRFLASKLGMPEELLQACTKHELAAILSNHFLERRAPLRVDRSRPPRWSFKNLSQEKLASLTRKQCSERKKGMRRYLERISSILGIPLGVLREMDAEAFDCAHALATERAAAEGQKIGSSALSRVNTVASIAPNSLRSPERKKRSSALVSGSPKLPTEGRISSTIIEEESKEKFLTFISEHSGIPKSDLRAMNDRDIAKAHAVAVREYDRRTSVGSTRSPLASPVVVSRNVIPADIMQSVPPGSKVVIVNPAENAVASNCNDPNCKLCPAPATSVTAVSPAASPSFMSAVMPNGYGESSTEKKPTIAENEQHGEEVERESKEEAQLRMSTEINTEKNRTRFSISTIDQVRPDSAQTTLDGHLPAPNVKEIIKHYNEQWAEPPESSKTEPPKAAGPAKVIRSTANTVQQHSPSNGMFVIADTMVSSLRASVISKGSPQPSFPQIRSPTKEDIPKKPEPAFISLGPPATKSGRVKPLIISPVPAFLSDDQTSSPQLSASSGSFSSIDNDERLLQKSIAAQNREKNDSGPHTKAVSGPISNDEDEGDPGQTSAEEEYLSARQSPVSSLLQEETQEPMCAKEESVGNEVSVPKNLSTDLPLATPAQANGDGHPERSYKGSVENMQEESGDKVENPIEKWKGQVLAAHTNIEDMHRPQKQSVTFQEPLVIKFSQTE